MTISSKAEDEGVSGTAVEFFNSKGSGRLLLICEHASNFIPPEYDNLGLDAPMLEAHIAWDPGALSLGKDLATKLDCSLVAPTISRLIFDVNRPLGSPSATPDKGEGRPIPGNENLSQQDIEARYEQVYVPFHRAISEYLDAESVDAVVTIHSFTPIFQNTVREVEVGILHDIDSRFADALIEVASSDGAYVVRRNEPYGMDDGVTHTLQKHAVSRKIPNVMIEIRNDLLKSDQDITKIGTWLTGHIEKALGAVG